MGPPELILILAIVALLFGPKLIPNLANGVGQASKELERGLEESEQELEELREDN